MSARPDARVRRFLNSGATFIGCNDGVLNITMSSREDAGPETFADGSHVLGTTQSRHTMPKDGGIPTRNFFVSPPSTFVSRNDGEINITTGEDGEGSAEEVPPGHSVVDSHRNVRGDHIIVVGSHCTVIGNNNNVAGAHCKVFGNYNKVTGAHCTVTGIGNRLSGAHSKAYGSFNTATGAYSRVCNVTPSRPAPYPRPTPSAPRATCSESAPAEPTGPGLDEDTMAVLVMAKTATERKRFECALCTEVRPRVVCVPCGHPFCPDCVLSWGKDHRTCPSCRKDIRTVVQTVESSDDDEPAAAAAAT